jgi:mannose-6-phosphate isomerase-like protein (cupin superfamily)
MRAKLFGLIALLPFITIAARAQTGGTGSLAQRIGHYQPDKNTPRKAPYGGAGTFAYTRVLADVSLSTPFNYMERGVIYPHSSIGEHYHGHSEELHIIIGGPDAQYTINGRTGTVPTPAGVPVRMGSSHGTYNPSADTPIEWIDINVGLTKGSDTYALGDSLETPPLFDKIPQFINFHMDPKLLKPVNNIDGGTGTVMYRRLLDPTVFLTPWSYVDEISMPSGAGLGTVTDPNMSEIYFVLSGTGSVKVNDEIANIKEGDAVPVDLGQTHSITQTGSEPLHLLAIGIAKDLAAKEAYIDKVRGGPAKVFNGTARPAN